MKLLPVILIAITGVATAMPTTPQENTPISQGGGNSDGPDEKPKFGMLSTLPKLTGPYIVKKGMLPPSWPSTGTPTDEIQPGSVNRLEKFVKNKGLK
jgi:hypothetical protein